VDSIDAALVDAQLVVVGTRDAALDGLATRLTPQQKVMDLVRIRELEKLGDRYIGINW
jgi:hypothetical protein